MTPAKFQRSTGLARGDFSVFSVSLQRSQAPLNGVGRTTVGRRNTRPGTENLSTAGLRTIVSLGRRRPGAVRDPKLVHLFAGNTSFAISAQDYVDPRC